MRNTWGVTVAAVMVVLATPARGDDPKEDGSRGMGMGMGAGASAMHEHMQKAGREMQHVRMTGDIDYDFVTAMRMHHQDGIKMAQMVLANGKDPKARELAQRIVEEQRRDLKEFDAWLARNRPDATGKRAMERSPSSDASTGAGQAAPEPGESPSAGTTSKGSEHKGAAGAAP